MLVPKTQWSKESKNFYRNSVFTFRNIIKGNSGDIENDSPLIMLWQSINILFYNSIEFFIECRICKLHNKNSHSRLHINIIYNKNTKYLYFIQWKYNNNHHLKTLLNPLKTMKTETPHVSNSWHQNFCIKI